jgi:hypothetical protein
MKKLLRVFAGLVFAVSCIIAVLLCFKIYWQVTTMQLLCNGRSEPTTQVPPFVHECWLDTFPKKK